MNEKNVSWGQRVWKSPQDSDLCQPVNPTKRLQGAEQEGRAAKGRGRSRVLGAHHNVGTPFQVKCSQHLSSEFNPGVRMKALRTHCPLTSYSLPAHWPLCFCPSPSPFHLFLPELWKYPPNWSPWNQSLPWVHSPCGWQQYISKTQTWCCLPAPRLTRNSPLFTTSTQAKPFPTWASPCLPAHRVLVGSHKSCWLSLHVHCIADCISNLLSLPGMTCSATYNSSC